MEAFVKCDGTFGVGVAKFGKNGEAFLQDAIDGRARCQCPRIVPSLADLSVEESDVAIAGENIIGAFSRGE